MRTFLTEAFKALDLLEEGNFDISKTDGFDKFKLFMDDDSDENQITVIDVDAENEEDLEDSYEGKIICDCPVCHSKIFKDIKDIMLNDEEDMANVGEECPYCYATDGFKVIGEVAPFHREYEAEATDKEGNPVDVEVEVETEEDKIDESLNESKKRKPPIDFPSNAEMIKELGFDYKDPELTKKAFALYNDGILTRNQLIFSFRKDDIEKLFSEVYKSSTKIESLAEQELDPGSPIDESLEKIKLETEEEVIDVEAHNKDEQIVPVDMEKEAEIAMEQPLEDAEIDVDIEAEEEEAPDEFDVEEFDEESFDELGESYLKQVYNNVESFKTTKISGDDSRIFVEGLITFNSGNTKKTVFKFNDYQLGKKNNLRIFGENLNLKTGRKSFTLTGKVNSGKFITEKFNYNYVVKNDDGSSTRINGRINKK